MTADEKRLEEGRRAEYGTIIANWHPGDGLTQGIVIRRDYIRVQCLQIRIIGMCISNSIIELDKDLLIPPNHGASCNWTSSHSVDSSTTPSPRSSSDLTKVAYSTQSFLIPWSERSASSGSRIGAAAAGAFISSSSSFFGACLLGGGSTYILILFGDTVSFSASEIWDLT